MQPHKLFLSAALALTCFLPAAQAEDWYAEGFVGGIVANEASDLTTRSQSLLPTIGLRGGYQLYDNFSIEGEIQTSVDSDVVLYAREISTVELRSSVGLYGKYSVPLNERFSLHTRLGFASSEFETKTGGRKEFIDTHEGLAYGVGGTFDVTNTWYLRGDATRYDSNVAETDSVSISAGLRF